MKQQWLIVGLGVALLGPACGDEEVSLGPEVQDSVAVFFDLPQCYAYAGLATRAGTETSRLFQTSDWPHSSLPEESTVWISYSKLDNKTGTYGSETMRPYVVRGMDSEYLSLYACGTKQTTINNTLWFQPDLTDVNASPLYLEEGNYSFRIMSPALAIADVSSKGRYCSLVENGVYFCSSDERYENTRGLNFDIKVNKSGVQRVELNPMVWQVAKISFTLTKGTHVHHLSVMSTGIEISGLQNPEEASGDKSYYNWRSGMLEDTIQMKLGDKRSWVRIAGSDCVTQSDGSITADVGVLPTDAMSTTIVILFNLSINGIATQYETTLNQIRLYHGHEYHLNVLVNGNEDITVTNWSTQSWTTNVTMEATPSATDK